MCWFATMLYFVFGLLIVIISFYTGYSGDINNPEGECYGGGFIFLILMQSSFWLPLFILSGCLYGPWRNSCYKKYGNTVLLGKLTKNTHVFISYTAYKTFFILTIIFTFIATIGLLFLYPFSINPLTSKHGINIFAKLIKIIIFIIIQLWTWYKTSKQIEYIQIMSLLYIASVDITKIDYYTSELTVNGIWTRYRELEIHAQVIGHNGRKALDHLNNILKIKYPENKDNKKDGQSENDNKQQNEDIAVELQLKVDNK